MQRAATPGCVSTPRGIFASGATKYGISLGSEILEEELQNFLEPAFRSIIFGEKYDMPTVQEIIDTAITAFITTSAIEGPGITSETIKEYGNNNALKTATNSVQPEQSSPNAPETIDVGKIGWDGRVAVEPATGPKVTVGGKTYELIGYDKDGAKVYQDVEVLKEQAEAESKQTDEIQTGEIEPQQDTEAKVNQEGVANEEHNAIITTWDNSLTPRGQVLEQISQEDLYGFAAAELGISTEMATEYIDVIMDYTDTSTNVYSEVRRYQREEPLQFLTQEEAKALSDKIEAYIQKAPRWNGGTTFRGSTVSDIELASYVPGYELHMGGVASWSDQESVARDFAVKNVTADRPNSVIYHCDTQGKGTGIQHISVVEMEAEVLCSKESRYVVDKVEIDENHVYHVYLKEE